jgi:hypothetical protein
MHVSIKIVVGAILCLIALVIMVVLFGGFTGDAQGSLDSMLDWFNKLIGR